MDEELVARADLNRQNVAGNLGRERHFAGIALGRVLGHEQRASARHALDRPKDATAARHLRVRGMAMVWVIQLSSPASEIKLSPGCSNASNTGIVVPTIRLCMIQRSFRRVRIDCRRRSFAKYLTPAGFVEFHRQPIFLP